MKKLILATALLGLTQSVQAAPACSLSSFDQLKTAILNQNKIGQVAMAPAQAYVGLSLNQTNANATAGAGESLFNDRVWNRFGVTVKAFIEGDGNVEAAATKMIGQANRRQSVTIYKRSNATEPSSPNANCGSGSCIDVSLEVMALHLVTGKSAQQVIDTLTAEKLTTTSTAKVYYCETGAGCQRKNEIQTSNSKVRTSKGSEAMKLNVPYTAREVASSIAGTIDNTSVYKVQSLDICGHQAFLMSGVGVKDANSFINSSSDVLVVEANGKILSIALAQGVAQKGSSVQGIFLSGLVGGIARGTVTKGYNTESELLGTSEEVDKNGILK